MKFYKGDYVKDKIGQEGTVIGRDTLDRLNTTLATGIYFDPELTLICRADEPAWPADVPRCDLPLPKGKTRWAARGYGWTSQNRDCQYAFFAGETGWLDNEGESGGRDYFYAEAVNDEDYTPPQLSESTNSSQVESKITKESRVVRLHHKDMPRYCVELDNEGHISINLNGDKNLSPNQAGWMAELLTAAAKESRR